ncbi:MAG TPA: ATP-binding protein [Chitinophagaceae bacterium]|nr:ATP-binding protein [Chitinophagaceae bacterium]
MKYNLKLLLFILFPCLVDAQQDYLDSLKNVFRNASDGPLRFKAARDVYNYYEELNRDSALYYAEQELLIGQNNHHKLAEGYGLINKGYQLTGLGRFADALQCLQQAFAIAEDKQNEKAEYWDLSALGFAGNNRLLVLSYAHHIFAILMLRTENLEQQIIHFKEAGRIGREIGYAPRYMLADMNLGQSYLTANKPDTALFYEKMAEQTAFQSSFKKYLGSIDLLMGDIYQALGDQSMSLKYYYNGLQAATEQNNRSSLSRIYLRLTKYHLATGNKDSALYYSRKNLQTIQSLGLIAGLESNIGIGYENVYLSYKLNQQFDSAFKYQGLALIAKDSLNKRMTKNLTAFHNLTFSEQLRLQNVEKEKTAYQNKITTYFLLAGIGVLLLLAIIFYRNNRQKQKAKIKIEQAYDNLKTTQAQLIQSEKMASLGELTAGIAHEIQNPLNFVNNFSEVNTELIEEMQQEMDKGNLGDAKTISNDIRENEEKINHHGKRADAIVKGMLQHSRSSNGIKEPTDINALADEYLRLAYHGLRAKDKSFNATMKTDFDETIGNINIIPQDIGRVILNLITNAFYAVTEKKKQTVDDYEPTVSVSTKKINGKVEIKVSDNGNGIPQKVSDKIFQPFFTTKPTGQGTGLGLSLSYDIIKAHGGEIKVETKEGEGTEFIVNLPYSSR